MESAGHAKSVGAAIESLCRNFEGQLLRLKETVTRSQQLEKKIEELESREVEDQKEYDRTADILNTAILEKKAAFKQLSDDAEKGAFKLSEEERELMAHCERIRKKVKALEDDNFKRQMILDQRKRQASEGESGLRAFRERKELLEVQLNQIMSDVTRMEQAVVSHSDLLKKESMVQTHEVYDIKVGKQELMRRQEDSRNLDNKLKKAELGLQRDARNLETKLSRLATLRQVHKVLQKKMKEKEETDKRFRELTEQSMELKFLVSSLMKDLALIYQVDAAELAGEDLPLEFCRNANELLHKQVQQIHNLQQTVQGRQAELARKRLGGVN